MTMNTTTNSEQNSGTPFAPAHGSAARSLPWWRRDKWGWPIETFKGKAAKSAIRIICQNIRKVTG